MGNYVKCELCSSDNVSLYKYYDELLSSKVNNFIKRIIFILLRKNTRHLTKKKFDLYKNLKVVRCQNCGFSSVQPKVSEKNQIDLFVNEYGQSRTRELRPDINSPRPVSQYHYLAENIPFRNIKTLIEFGAAGAAIGRHIAVKNNINEISVVEPGVNWHELYQYSEVPINSYHSLFEVNDCFDLFLSSFSFVYVHDFDLFFTKIISIINQAGYLFFDVPNCNDLWYKMKMGKKMTIVFFCLKSVVEIVKRYPVSLIHIDEFGASFGEEEFPGEEKCKQHRGGRYLRFILQKT